jgi:chloramphenicol-sensitive protein RarD
MLGMFQYLAPTLAFLLAVGVYGEPFTRGHAVSFGCVWVALALSMWETLSRAPRAGAGRES